MELARILVHPFTDWYTFELDSIYGPLVTFLEELSWRMGSPLCILEAYKKTDVH